jgi:hypothetical protein
MKMPDKAKDKNGKLWSKEKEEMNNLATDKARINTEVKGEKRKAKGKKHGIVWYQRPNPLE